MPRVLRPRERGAPRGLKDWVKTRPPVVQALAAEFPPGCVVTDPQGDDWYVMGYGEPDHVILVPFWPWPGEDRYARAMSERQVAHAAHLRDGSARVRRQEH